MPAPTLILASRSPRRAALLTAAGYRFTAMIPPYDDPPTPTGDDPRLSATEQAKQKAHSLLHHPPPGGLPPNPVILAADTVILTANHHLVGTPTTPDQARAMLTTLTGHTHHVTTAVAIATADQPIHTLTDTAAVSLGPLEPHTIHTYIETGLWRGKAGGYNLTDRTQAGWPIRVTGEPSTVMGLPIPALVAALAHYNIAPTTNK